MIEKQNTALNMQTMEMVTGTEEQMPGLSWGRYVLGQGLMKVRKNLKALRQPSGNLG